ncbi:MAG: SDR family oxidoreductase, partial [Rhodobacterales bacterium]|nr:SDR family oxidoreductase [Rhodobacterales bacterium]
MIPSVLVTGGLGYLGGRLLAHLREAGFGALRATSRRARRPAWFQDLDLVQTGMDDFGGLVGACTGVDAVVHLAALNAQACGADPALARAVNVGGTERLLRAAHAAGVERVVYLSTAHVYGAPLAGRLDEHSPTVSGNPGAQPPAHPYATTHRAAEDAVRDWAGRTGGTAVVLRLSNAVGAPMDAGADCWMLLVNDLCRQAVTTGRLALRGPGLDRRDYLPLADAVAAVAHLLAADRNVLGDGLFNVGSGESRETIAV